MNRASSNPTASVGDTLGFLPDMFIPTAAKGPLIRRPRVEALAERLGLDRRAGTPSGTRP